MSTHVFVGVLFVVTFFHTVTSHIQALSLSLSRVFLPPVSLPHVTHLACLMMPMGVLRRVNEAVVTPTLFFCFRSWTCVCGFFLSFFF